MLVPIPMRVRRMTPTLAVTAGLGSISKPATNVHTFTLWLGWRAYNLFESKVITCIELCNWVLGYKKADWQQ